MNKKVVSILILAMAQSAVFANINVFNRSLPNRAGVSFDYITDTWDTNTVAGFYQEGKQNNFSMVYGKNQFDGTGDNSEAAASARMEIGIPLYVAFGQKNKSTFNDDGIKKTTVKDFRTTGQIGTTFGGFGVALFADVADNSQKYTDTDLEWSKTVQKYGINMGSSTANLASAWTLGIGATILDDVKNAAGTKTNTGYTFDLDGDTVPDYDNIYGKGYAIEVASEGWIPLGANFLGWLAEVYFINTKGEKSDTTHANEYTGLNYLVNPFYTFKLPLGKESSFFVNPGVSVEGKYFDVKPLAGGDHAPVSEIGTYFTMPMMFKFFVTQSKNLSLQAGVNTKTTIYSTGLVTDSKPKTVSKDNADGMGSFTLGYGFGATYQPNENLRMHALFDTQTDYVNASFNLGVDYLFTAGE